MNGHFGGGKGTQDNPYLIEDVWDFNKIRNYPTKSFKLINDINFLTPPFNEGFLPIKTFVGQLDGDGHKLLNVYINKSEMENVGIFSEISFATASYSQKPFIKNICIENANVSGYKCTGILIGKLTYTYNNGANYGEFLTNIYVSGKVQSQMYVSGLIGYMNFTHNNYTMTFASNIQTNVNLYPLASNTYTSPIIGYINCNNLNYTNTVTLLKDSLIKAIVGNSAITFNQAFINLYNNSNVTFTTQYYYRLTNNIYDACWNAFSSTFITTTMSEEEYSKSANISTWMATITNFSDWVCNYGYAPHLACVKDGEIFIKYNNKYYTYQNDKFKEIMVHDYNQARDNGINATDLSSITFFNKLQILINKGNYEIVTMINTNKGMVYNNEKTLKLSPMTTKTSKNSQKILVNGIFNFNNINANDNIFKFIGN